MTALISKLKTASRLRVVYRQLGDLAPDPKNPRTHSARQIGQLARSIKAFGFNVPLLVGRDGKVIAGHGRLLAVQKLGWSEVPTISLEHLSPDQARAYMLADNRLTDQSTWDDQLLAEHLRELSLLDLNFDIEATGFSMGEIDLRIEGLSGEEADAADGIPLGAGLPAVTRPGDLWQLGLHRIYCASALEHRSYRTLMAGKKAAAVFSDPPYNVRIDGHVSGNGAVRHREFVQAAGEMGAAEFTEFLSEAFHQLARHSLSGSLHYLCMDWRHLGEMLAAGSDAYTDLLNLCVWTKDRAGMGSLYRSQHELVFVYKSGRGRHRNNVELGRHGRHRSNVWAYPSANTFSRCGEEGNLLAQHPTVKPVRMVVDAILDSTARGDIVLDPFLGSGTTIMACERSGRIGYGLELDRLYCDTSVRRWQQYTGGEAIHVESGQTFHQRQPGNANA